MTATVITTENETGFWQVGNYEYDLFCTNQYMDFGNLDKGTFRSMPS